MFCSKCGSQLPEGAVFCQKCGAKLSYENMRQQPLEASAKAPKKAAESVGSMAQPQIVPSDVSKKKKTGKLPVIIGIAALIIVAAIIIAVNWEGKVDYAATVKAYTPFATNYGMPYTCEEVFDQYFDSLEWKVHEDDGIHYVDVSGTSRGTDDKFAITFKVSSNSDNRDDISINIKSIALGNRKSSEQEDIVRVLYNLFCMYDEGYEIQDFIRGDEDALQGEVILTETFIDQNTGISFRYPAGWTILDSSSEFHPVEMIDSGNTSDRIASFNVNMIFDMDPYGVFTQSEASVRKAVSESNTFLDFGDVLLGDIPAKVLAYQTKGLNSDDIVVMYWYKLGEDTYQVTCSCTASAIDIYGPVFDAVMNSYTIITSMQRNPDIDYNIPTSDIRFNDIPVEELLNSSAVELVQRFGGAYNADGNGRIYYDEIGFYMLDDETVDYIWSFYPEYFSINGYTLNMNSEGVIYSDEIIELLGRDYADEWLDIGYFMSYQYPAYILSFEINKYNEVCSIMLRNSFGMENSPFDYNADGNMAGSEPIESYYMLSGSYSGYREQSILSLSIYSSQEEGETSIGTVEIYVAGEYYCSGEVVPINKGTYKVTADTQEEIVLMAYESDSNIVLQLYADGQYIEEYWMVEHYES